MAVKYSYDCVLLKLIDAQLIMCLLQRKGDHHQNKLKGTLLNVIHYSITQNVLIMIIGIYKITSS